MRRANNVLDTKRPIVAFALLGLAGTAVCVALLLAGTKGSVARGNGLTVRYPAGWHPATEVLTPNVTDPREVLAIGTGRFRPGGTLCAHMPENALNDMSASDALVWVAEREWTAEPRAGGGFEPLPDHLPPSAEFRDRDESHDCAPDKDFTSWWFTFGRNRRAFHVLVAFGPRTTAERQREAWRMLEGIGIATR